MAKKAAMKAGRGREKRNDKIPLEGKRIVLYSKGEV